MIYLDPGFRRDDGSIINQSILRKLPALILTLFKPVRTVRSALVFPALLDFCGMFLHFCDVDTKNFLLLIGTISNVCQVCSCERPSQNSRPIAC
jgi:hypothetical protein